ncbi:MAG: hypothetical protein NUV90_00780 [Candidatus Parcubacteria bacterium]|nr:hypothetical protein [Candidatus Parcubacteria bacterium]
MRIVLFIICSLISIAAMATEPTKQRCDAVITKSFKMQDQEASIKLLNSKPVQECFRRFPDLNDKFFPIKMESSRDLKGPPVNKDPAYSIKMR